MRVKLEEEKRALVSFVSMVDSLGLGTGGGIATPTTSPQRTRKDDAQKLPSLLDQVPEEDWSILGDLSFELEAAKGKAVFPPLPKREVFGAKENMAT